jgi:CoA:oxalate CoA-transferase
VPDTAELLELPPHVERRWFQEIEHPAAGALNYPGAPFHLQDTPWQVQGPAPLLGQHNAPVLCGDLGLTREELVRLRSQGII